MNFLWNLFETAILSLSDFPERFFYGFGQIWERITNAILWYWSNFSLLSLTITLLLVIGIANLVLHLINHRKMRQESRDRGYKNGYDEGYKKGREER